MIPQLSTTPAVTTAGGGALPSSARGVLAWAALVVPVGGSRSAAANAAAATTTATTTATATATTATAGALPSLLSAVCARPSRRACSCGGSGMRGGVMTPAVPRWAGGTSPQPRGVHWVPSRRGIGGGGIGGGGIGGGVSSGGFSSGGIGSGGARGGCGRMGAVGVVSAMGAPSSDAPAGDGAAAAAAAAAVAGSPSASMRKRAAAEATAAGRVAISVGPFHVALPGRVVLAGVPALWSTFLVVTRLLHTLPVALSPPLFNAARLCIAAAVYLPTTLREVRRGRAAAVAAAAATDAASGAERKGDSGGAVGSDSSAGMDFLAPGVELGLWVTLANTAQIAGLATTSASRAAFLVQLESIFVPLVSVALGHAPLSAKMLLSTAVTFAGVAVLAGDPSGQVPTAGASAGDGIGRFFATVSVGDGLEVLAAVFLSIYVLRTNYHVQRVRQATPLVAVKIVTQAVLAVAWVAVRYAIPALWRWVAALAEWGGGGGATAASAATAAAGGGWAAALPMGITGGVVALNVALVLWSGLIVSATTSWMQAAGQRVVPAADTALLFATKPLWATASAAVVLGESFGQRGVVGGLLVLAGVLAVSWNPSATARRRRRGGGAGGGGDTSAATPFKG